MTFQRHLTYRVQNIPSQFTSADLRGSFHSDDKKYIEVKSLVPDVNNYDGNGYLTATILFSTPEPAEPRIDDENLDIDKDFIGFTPLNEATEDVCADIIAVTGLAGHAFGSWSHNAQKMWLRDYLPKDIQDRARILIYGYESQLQGASAAKSTISDHGNSFIQSLMDIRDHPSCRDRPLILIAITDLKPSIRSRLPVRTVLFFGAPHNGLEIKALETLVKGQPTQTLISELKHDSPTLSGLADRFSYIADNLSIHSYYESRPTPTVVRTADGKWERCGELKVMVERSSALLNHKQEETRMKVDGDHKEIARLRRGQGGVYPNVLRIIKDALQSASEQFAAAAQQPGNQKSVSPEPSDPTADESNGNYDDSILICDGCYDEFAKTKTHYNCIICESGYFNLCRSCEKSGKTCPGRHDLYERKLDGTSDDNDEDSSEDEFFDNYLSCDGCGTAFPKDKVHFHCIICDNGDYNICLPCRKTGRTCPGRHKMHKRQLPSTPPMPGKSDDDVGLLATPTESVTAKESYLAEEPRSQTPEKESNMFTELSSTTQYCDKPDCNCSLPKKPRSPIPEKEGSSYTEYCDKPGCECGLPKRPRSSASEKESSSYTEYCDRPGCECGLPKRPRSSASEKESSSYTEYCDRPGCECGLPKRPRCPTPEKESSNYTEYCNKPGCECGLPKRPRCPTPEKESSNYTEYCNKPGCKCGLPKGPRWSISEYDSNLCCRGCGRSFSSRNSLFEHLRESNHMVE